MTQPGITSHNTINKFNRLMRLWRDLREAIGGSEQDFTQGPISRAILLLSVPMALEMMMESVFAIADIFFVSRLGPEAVATVGITESLITIVYAIAIGFSTAASSVVSRRIGEKNPEGASVAAFQAILAALFMSAVIAIPGALFARRLLGFMGASPVIVNEMSGFTMIMLGGNTVIMLLFVINGIFRSAGDAAFSMRVLWMANILNILLDPLLIFGIGPFHGLGIRGAAIATTTGRGMAVMYQLFLLFNGKRRVKLAWRHIRFDKKVMATLVRLALGSTGQHLIITSSWIVLVRIIAIFGSVVVAGYTIALRILIFAMLPSWGISNAASTLVGQNLGAGQPSRAQRSVWITAWTNVILLGLVGLILALWPGSFIRLFVTDPPVVAAGITALRMISLGSMAYGLGMVLVNAINGAGDTLTPLRINVFCFWLLEIPLAYWLALQAGMGEAGVYWSIVVAESMMTLAALWYFKKGTWKLKKV
ncbi:MAG: MATE family efflux transporter [Bacteroidales bacterium]